MHKNKNITLLPLSPADVRKHFNELTEHKKKQPAMSESSNDKYTGIKLKGGTFIATTSATVELCDNHDAPCYIMLSQDVRVLDGTMSCMHPAVTNILQKHVDDEMESRTTPVQ